MKGLHRQHIDGPLSSASTASWVAIEIKRKAGIDAVEQLTRYLHLINRDPLVSPCRGILVALDIAPQAQRLAADRGIQCVTVDYDELRGIERPQGASF